jgi:prepilin-type N-terminal cleavage/methylation domain-containing protein
MPRSTDQRGFTLIELMVSLVLFSVAVAGVLSVAVTMSSAFRDQRALVQTESSARSPMDFMADILRNASPGVQSGIITDGTAVGGSTICNTPQAIIVTNNVTSGSNIAPNSDTIELIYASGGSLAVTDSSGFAPGDYAIITDTNFGILVKIQNVSTGLLTFYAPTCTTNTPVGGYAQGSLVIRAMHAKFYIDPNPDNSTPPIPNLMALLDPNSAGGGSAQPVTDGIEDMQVAVAIDRNSTPGIQEVGLIPDDDDWVFNVAGEALPTWPYAIRSIRLTLVARAVNVNQVGTAVLSFARPAAEDHVSGGSDNIRRRELQSSVEIRNLQGSP